MFSSSIDKLVIVSIFDFIILHDIFTSTKYNFSIHGKTSSTTEAIFLLIADKFYKTNDKSM